MRRVAAMVPGLTYDICVLTGDFRAVYPLRQLLLAFYDLAREPNDHIILVGRRTSCRKTRRNSMVPVVQCIGRQRRSNVHPFPIV
jgi:hypothetical protein